MLLKIRGSERHLATPLEMALFRFRHEVFVIGRKWSLPSRHGLEVDQYDGPDAVYFCERTDDGSIESHVRLTPTVQHSLLADYFPHLVEGDISPRGETIWEATRYIARPAQKSRRRNRRTKANLLVEMLQWAKANGISHIQTVIDTATFASFVEMTSETIALGLSHAFGGGTSVTGGGECMAIRWPVTDKVISDLRAYGELSCEVCSGRGICEHGGFVADGISRTH